MDQNYRQHAADREILHKHHKSSRPLSKEYEGVGVAGEIALGEFLDEPVDINLYVSGDGGKDFKKNGYTLDVKTARKPGNLILEVGKKAADILVLAKYSDKTKKAWLIGWDFGKVLEECPSRDFGYGIINHFKLASQLHQMDELAKLLGLSSIPKDISISPTEILYDCAVCGRRHFPISLYRKWLRRYAPEDIQPKTQAARWQAIIEQHRTRRAKGRLL